MLAFCVILKSNLKTFNLIGRQSLSPPLMAVRLQLVKELFCCLLIIIPLSNACWSVFTDPPTPPKSVWCLLMGYGYCLPIFTCLLIGLETLPDLLSDTLKWNSGMVWSNFEMNTYITICNFWDEHLYHNTYIYIKKVLNKKCVPIPYCYIVKYLFFIWNIISHTVLLKLVLIP